MKARARTTVKISRKCRRGLDDESIWDASSFGGRRNQKQQLAAARCKQIVKPRRGPSALDATARLTRRSLVGVTIREIFNISSRPAALEEHGDVGWCTYPFLSTSSCPRPTGIRNIAGRTYVSGRSMCLHTTGRN